MKKAVILAVILCAGLAIWAIAAKVSEADKTEKFANALAEPSVGSPAPAFTLIDTRGKQHNLADFKGKYVVLEWVNFGCPFVKKHYGSGNMQATQKKAVDRGVVWLSVCSSADGKQGHMAAAEWNNEIASRKMASTAVLIDESGQVGKTYGAKTTPHMYIVNPDGVLIYKGAIDDKPTTDQDDIPGARNHVLAALDESMAGKPVSTASTTPYGCSVKY
ncbi:MAG TPA: redoxin domain-containing protein [Thermoanaerobaculia bacterium]|nr:redoxin domain-containing protein [Thermoanaerobaculia bacterium]